MSDLTISCTNYGLKDRQGNLYAFAKPDYWISRLCREGLPIDLEGFLVTSKNLSKDARFGVLDEHGMSLTLPISVVSLAKPPKYHSIRYYTGVHSAF